MGGRTAQQQSVKMQKKTILSQDYYIFSTILGTTVLSNVSSDLIYDRGVKEVRKVRLLNMGLKKSELLVMVSFICHHF